jgi:DNA-binding NarL/FixJ family response regulator
VASKRLGIDDAQEGWVALNRGAWQEARLAFEHAVDQIPDANALEGLAWAAWWQHDGDAVLGARERAYELHRAAGDRAGAARVATLLGSDYADFLGDDAVARGWLRRARRLLDGLKTIPEHGWLAALEAWYALIEDDDTARGRSLGAAATRLGRQLGSPELEAVGMATEGLALVTEGLVDEGMPLLDEAATAALSGEFEQLWTVPWPCCFLIYACERVHDYARAAQWCRKVEEFSAQRGLGYAWGICRAHHAAVLVFEGEWEAAERELHDAGLSLEENRPPWVVEVTVRLGELRRRQGRLDEAVSHFRLVESHPLALLGLAEISLDRGELAAAREFAERLLRRVPATARTQRAGALQILVRAGAALGEHDAAATALADLDAIAAIFATLPLQATAAFCAGVLEASRGDHEAARRRLEDALDLAGGARLPYEAARTRIELAGLLTDLGRIAEATDQAIRAEEDLRRLGATRDADRAAALAGRRRPVLTPRECEVLALVADGLSDRQIAATLVLSEHTVHRHISNVLAKLSCASRAAAVARVAELGLLGSARR